MAKPEEEEERLRMRSFVEEEKEHDELKKLAKSFLVLSFSVMLAHLPNDAISLVPRLTSQVTELKRRLATAEEQVRQMKSRRVEDSKANARVVEIFASHRNAWQEEEKRLLNRIHEIEEEREDFMNRISELEREVSERDEMIGFMSRREIEEEDDDDGQGDESSERYAVDHLTLSSSPSPNAYGNFNPFQVLILIFLIMRVKNLCVWFFKFCFCFCRIYNMNLWNLCIV
jgi:DNA repair exonuclease SbcCD ATPase subunit